jgi:Skp family chaperone for outer membrane proteins
MRFVLAGAILMATWQSAEPASVAVVDAEQAFQRSPLVLAMAAWLNERFDGRKRELRAQTKRLAGLRGRLEGASDAERAKLAAQIQEESEAIRLAMERYRQDLAAAQRPEGELMIEKALQMPVDARLPRLRSKVNA